MRPLEADPQGRGDGDHNLISSEVASLFPNVDERTKLYWRGIEHSADEQMKRQQRSTETNPLFIDKNAGKGLFKGTHGERYRVSLLHCECYDFRRHRRPCKHMYRLAAELGCDKLLMRKVPLTSCIYFADTSPTIVDKPPSPIQTQYKESPVDSGDTEKYKEIIDEKASFETRTPSKNPAGASFVPLATVAAIIILTIVVFTNEKSSPGCRPKQYSSSSYSNSATVSKTAQRPQRSVERCEQSVKPRQVASSLLAKPIDEIQYIESSIGIKIPQIPQAWESTSEATRGRKPEVAEETTRGRRPEIDNESPFIPEKKRASTHDILDSGANIPSLNDLVDVTQYEIPLPPPVVIGDFKKPTEEKPNSITIKSSENQRFHGNRQSHIFHNISCRYFNCRNCTAVFNSREDALKKGYKPCGICKP